MSPPNRMAVPWVALAIWAGQAVAKSERDPGYRKDAMTLDRWARLEHRIAFGYGDDATMPRIEAWDLVDVDGDPL